jgi:hypothetical protein
MNKVPDRIWPCCELSLVTSAVLNPVCRCDAGDLTSEMEWWRWENAYMEGVDRGGGAGVGAKFSQTGGVGLGGSETETPDKPKKIRRRILV